MLCSHQAQKDCHSLSQPATVSLSLDFWSGKQSETGQHQTLQIPPKIHRPAEAHPLRGVFLIWEPSPQFHPPFPVISVSPGYYLSWFSFQPLVISAAICLYLKMFTSHLPTPSDPSIKSPCCICVNSQSIRILLAEKKSPKTAWEKGLFSIFPLHQETQNSPTWKKG